LPVYIKYSDDYSNVESVSCDNNTITISHDENGKYLLERYGSLIREFIKFDNVVPVNQSFENIQTIFNALYNDNIVSTQGIRYTTD